METVLVTGGSGYIGSFCILELLRRGYNVHTTIRSLKKENELRVLLKGGLASTANLSKESGQISAEDSAYFSAIDLDKRLKVFAADLTADAGWDEAVSGCDYVLHVASPLAKQGAENPDDLIIPARDGSMRVVKAATKAGVKRVVVTSSVAASGPTPDAPDSINDENVWTDPKAKGVNAYRQSKTLAERAIWEYMKTYDGPTTVTTILPTAVLGPVLTGENLGSVQLVSRLLNGQFPGNPRLGFNIVDVRELADIHIKAMTAPEAAGERFIATGDFYWLEDISKVLRKKLGAKAKKVPTLPLPDFVLHLASLFDPVLKFVTPDLGHKHSFTSAKAERVLAWRTRPTLDTIIDCANSLIEKKVVI